MKHCEACGKPLDKDHQKAFRFHAECLPSHPKFGLTKNRVCAACGKPLKKGIDHRIRFHTQCRPSKQRVATASWHRICLICEKPLLAKKWNQRVHQGKCKKIRDAQTSRKYSSERWALKHSGASLPDREYRVHGMDFSNDWDA